MAWMQRSLIQAELAHHWVLLQPGGCTPTSKHHGVSHPCSTASACTHYMYCCTVLYCRRDVLELNPWSWAAQQQRHATAATANITSATANSTAANASSATGSRAPWQAAWPEPNVTPDAARTLAIAYLVNCAAVAIAIFHAGVGVTQSCSDLLVFAWRALHAALRAKTQIADHEGLAMLWIP